MDNEYVIEKGIPIPHSRGSTRGRWADLARSMNVGDSVLVNGRLEAMNLRGAIVMQGFRCVTRGNDKPQTRVWKMLPASKNEFHLTKEMAAKLAEPLD